MWIVVGHERDRHTRGGEGERRRQTQLTAAFDGCAVSLFVCDASRT